MDEDDSYFGNVDSSSDADEAAELEAHLYSKIYYEQDASVDNNTSVKMYNETGKETPCPDSGLGSTGEPSGSTSPVEEMLTTSDDVVIILSDSEVVPTENETSLRRKAKKGKSLLNQNKTTSGKRSSDATASLQKINAKTVSNKRSMVDANAENSRTIPSKKARPENRPPQPSTSTPKNRLNPFYENHPSESDDSVVEILSSDDEVNSSKYNEVSQRSKQPPTKDLHQKQTANDKTGEASSSSSSSSSDEDEGIQIIQEVDAALERSRRAQLVDLIESEQGEDSELELGHDWNLTKEKPKKSAPSKEPAKSSNPKTPLSREEARVGRLVVQVENQEFGSKQRAQHFVAQKNSSSSDDSTSSSDDEDLSTPARLSLNLIGGRFGNCTPSLRERSFKEVTGTPASAVKTSKNKFKNWTKEMGKFYNELDPQMADIKLEELISTPECASTPKNWLKTTSVNSIERRSSRYFLSCSICGGRGHQPRDCRQRNHYRSRCYMCGGDDHSKEYCPQMMCLRCGMKGMPYTSSCSVCRNKANVICHHCGAKGHEFMSCPDNWRRYHLTTEPGKIDKPVDPTIDHSKAWCPNCSRKGHLVHQCRAFSSSMHPKSNVTVISYREMNKKRKFNDDDDDEEPGADTAPESGEARRLKKRQLKEKRKAFRSFPHTPTTNGENLDISKSAPASPRSSSHSNRNMLIESALKQAKQKLILLAKEKVGLNTKPKKLNKKAKARLQQMNTSTFSPQMSNNSTRFSSNSSNFSPKTPNSSKFSPKTSNSFPRTKQQADRNPSFSPVKPSQIHKICTFSSNSKTRKEKRFFEWREKRRQRQKKPQENSLDFIRI